MTISYVYVNIYRFLIGIYVSIDVMSKHKVKDDSKPKSFTVYNSQSNQAGAMIQSATLKQPDWSLESWSPISIDVSRKNGKLETSIKLCKLNFQQYSSEPHLYPMFRDLIAKSNCRGDNVRTESLRSLLVKIRSTGSTDGSQVKVIGLPI